MGGVRRRAGALRDAGGGAVEGMPQCLLIRHLKRLFQLSASGAVVRPERPGSGASAGRRVAGLFVGVVSGVSRLSAALTGLGAL